MNTTEIGDVRGKQLKSLQRWEEQKAQWDKIQRGLARRVGKPDGTRTLQGSTHEFRMRSEELGMIETSVPAEVKNGVSAWEMNLRAGGGGVRYVQVGSSYPYPLYCPVRDPAEVKMDSNNLMKVIPQTVPVRDKPVSSTAFFHTRQHEFQKHIRNKFSHFGADSFFSVEGAPAPTTAQPVFEDAGVPPVTYHPTEKPPQSGRAGEEGGLHADPRGDSPASSRPETTSFNPPAPGGGPTLVLSSGNLHFSAAPGETVQATLRIENTGTTAVFYSWANCEGDAVLPLAPSNSHGGPPINPSSLPATSLSPSAEGLFRLSDVPNAVLLPEDEKFFTVSFRSPQPGIFTQLLELLTVPAGRERIVVHLRAVVVGSSADNAEAKELEGELAARVGGDAAASMLVGEVVHRARDNPFAAAEEHLAEQRVAQAEEAVRTARRSVVAKHRAAWAEHNASLGLPWHPDVYAAFTALYRNARTFALEQHPRAKLPPPPANPPSRSPTPVVPVDVAPEGPPCIDEEWSGSVREILEMLCNVRDAEAHRCYLAAVHTLIDAATCAEPIREGEDTDADGIPILPGGVSLCGLIGSAAGRAAWGACTDRVVSSIATASEVAAGRPLVKTGTAPKATDGKGTGGKGATPAKGKTPAAQSQPANAVPEGSAVAPEVLAESTKRVAFSLARRAVSDAIVETFAARDASIEAVQQAVWNPLGVALAHRWEEALQPEADRDMEPLVDPTAGKKKK